jgi:integrase
MDLLVETREALWRAEPPPFKDKLAQWQDGLIGSGIRIGSVREYRKRVLDFLKFHIHWIERSRTGLRGGSSILFDVLKQEEVKAMVEKARKPHYKAVIGFLAQTGQRTHVLRGITWGMIDWTNGRPHGIASVPEKLEDRKGRTVRIGHPYTFVIGRDTMGLLDQWPQTEKRKAGGTFVFGLSERHIHRIVAEAANDANVQKDSGRIMPGKTVLYKVHPDAFPTYWLDRVKGGGMDRVQAKFMMGYDMGSEARERGSLRSDRLLSAYRKAEPMLGLFEVVE